jgi:hypothetical protein
MKARLAALALPAALLAGCSSVHIGIGLPIPGIGSVGVGVGSDGRVSGGVSVGSGAVSVGVGGSAQLPRAADAPASAASGAAAKP